MGEITIKIKIKSKKEEYGRAWQVAGCFLRGAFQRPEPAAWKGCPTGPGANIFI